MPNNSWWVVPRANRRAAVRLICFPYAGGGASIFRSWHLALPNNMEVCAIQMPGRQNRILESPFTRMSALLPQLGKAILPFLDRPFAFFGHSVGAVLSFEVSRWLRQNRNPLPRCLFVSARRAPHLSDTDPPTYLMNDEDFLAEIRRLKATPEEILTAPDLMKFLLPTLRADSELCETYQYVPDVPLSCPIIAFAGVNDQTETLERMEAWASHTAGDFSLHAFPDDHFFIHSSEQQLLDLLGKELSARAT